MIGFYDDGWISVYSPNHYNLLYRAILSGHELKKIIGAEIVIKQDLLI
ncbi:MULTISPECIES: hypothetical protein [Bacillus]|nr:hypothetical protein BSM4216_1315 [Bacillus smithii]